MSGDSGSVVHAVAVQTGPAGDSFQENLEKASAMAEAAAEPGSIIVFPELYGRPFWCVGLSDPAYFDWAEPLDGPVVTHAATLARTTRSTVVAPFFERGAVDGEYYNSVAVLGPDGAAIPGRLPDGTRIPVYRKNAISAFRWDDAVNDEKFYFRPGNGFAIFDTPQARIGVLVCVDRWFPEAWRVLALQGAEVICVVNASQGDVDDLFVPSMRTCAAQNVVFTVAVNRGGVEEHAGRSAEFYGRSCIVDPSGTVLAQAAHGQPDTVAADLDLTLVTQTRRRRTMYRDRRPELYTSLCQDGR
jgi:N-carbamoylputrescine amidase